MDTPDLALLERHARCGDEAAFAEVVRRHLNLVHSVALRHVRSPQLAEEVAQSVFADLARQAGRLGPGTVLPAWLWSVARRTAVDTVRREARRRQREQTAHELSVMNTPDADWSQIAPLLDEALQSLDETDRAVVVLRWFENKPLREVAATLGTSEDAAQKRASRALDRLREWFTQRGVTVGAGGLAALISTHAVQAAPAGLAAVVTGGALVNGAATTGWIVALGTAIFTMTSTSKIILATALIGTVGVVTACRVYEPASTPAQLTPATSPEPAAVSPDAGANPVSVPNEDGRFRLPSLPKVGGAWPAPLSNLILADDRPVEKFILTDAPLDMVLDQLSEWTGRTVVRPENLRPGILITISITRSVSRNEAVRAVISVLQLNGIGIEPEGDKVLRVVVLARPAS
jgi:RNA polymerase sigma factor (sigma-70 family)